MNLTTVLLTAFFGFMVATLGFAWVRGGKAERAGVVLVLAMAAFSIVAEALFDSRFVTVDWHALVEDVAGFAGFTWIGLRARRYWPLCAASLQLLSLGAHLARMVDLAVHPMVYSLMKSVPTALVCLAIALGAQAYYRRRIRALSMGYPGCASPASWKRRSPG